MTRKNWHAKGWPATPMLAALISLGVPAALHAAPAQYQNQSQNSQPAHDSDITRQELTRFDEFLDSHREIAEQVKQNPSLVNNDEFVKGHPALQTFMQQHPAVREELKENPNAFMHREAIYDRHEDQRMRDERAHFDRFLGDHHEIAEQLRRDPKLINDEGYVKANPDLHSYLQDHPEFRDAVRKNPDAFVRQGDRRDDNDRYARQNNDDRDRDARADSDRDRDARRDNDNSGRDRDARNDNDTRDRDARADNDRDRDARRDNDNSDRDRDARNDNDTRDRDARANNDRDRDARTDNNHRDDRDRDAHADNDRDRDARRDSDARYKQGDANDRDRDARHDELANFDHYLDSHRETAEQLRKDPSLVNNDEFVKNHPSLQSYLQQHPGVRTALKDNPNAFIQEARYDQNEYRTRGGAGDEPHRHFGEFLGGHSGINEQLSKDPSLVKNDEYMQSHPELKDYLNQHPDVRQGLMQNPETFVKSSQQFNTTNKNGSYSGSTQAAPATGSKPATDATKPKQ